MRETLDCGNIRTQLVAYIDRELAPEQYDRVLVHLSGCPACRQELEGLTSTQRHLRQALRLRAAEITAPAGVWTMIQERTVNARPPSFLERFANILKQPAWQGALVFVLIVAWSVLTIFSTGVIPGFGGRHPASTPPQVTIPVPTVTTTTAQSSTLITPTPTTPAAPTTTPAPEVIVTQPQPPAPSITLEIPAAPMGLSRPDTSSIFLFIGVIFIGILAVILIWTGRRRHTR